MPAAPSLSPPSPGTERVLSPDGQALAQAWKKRQSRQPSSSERAAALGDRRQQAAPSRWQWICDASFTWSRSGYQTDLFLTKRQGNRL